MYLSDCQLLMKGFCSAANGRTNTTGDLRSDLVRSSIVTGLRIRSAVLSISNPATIDIGQKSKNVCRSPDADAEIISINGFSEKIQPQTIIAGPNAHPPTIVR